SCARNVDLSPSVSKRTSSNSKSQPSFSQFADIPIMAGSTMDMDLTLIFGAGDSWTGRLVMNAPQGSVAAFDFYHRGTPEFGWREIASVRSSISVLTYMHRGRVLTLQIRDNTIRGSEIRATVTPEKDNSFSPPGARAPVQSAPVRPVNPSGR
ncbi:MAG: hypothetical protein QGF09_04960, partial [Rhodospirillales bacterium]|nr:hypothetical protein [Rhodospirillales bacterium]